jgi:hypothetical protein
VGCQVLTRTPAQVVVHSCGGAGCAAAAPPPQLGGLAAGCLYGKHRAAVTGPGATGLRDPCLNARVARFLMP